MKKKAFTLVELLVVIAIIALLMGILMPALARVRMIAYRMVCGSNQSGIGKALLLYAGDAQEQYPMPGNSGAGFTLYETSGRINGGVYDGSSTPIFGQYNSATIGSLLFMLIRYEDVAPKQFNCKGDSKAEIFKISSANSACSSHTTVTDVTKLYDFGCLPGKYNSYAYHMPFTSNSTMSGFPVTVNSPPNTPLAADRNPCLDKNAAAYLSAGSGTTKGGAIAAGTTADLPYKVWDGVTINEYKDKDFVYNAYAHQREGQNVLYNDGHVKFESTTNVGINNDNIYQRWITGAMPTTPPAVPSTPRDWETGGYYPTYNTSNGITANYIPADSTDALMINEINP